jgi:putative transcriptional regulator
MDIEKIAQAIEADAGEALPDLRQSLLEMQNLTVGRITTPEQLLVVSVRKQLQLTQQTFAELIKTPVATLRDWEQGRFKPNGVVICLLNILNKHPEIAEELTVL